MSTQKYPFGRYDKLFLETATLPNGNNAYLTKYITDAILPKVQGTYFWKEHFTVDTTTLELPPKEGFPVYGVTNIVRKPSPMFDGHTPGTEVSTNDTDGYSTKTGQVMQFARGIFENALSMEEVEAMYEAAGGDADIMAQYTVEAVKLVQGFNNTLSHLGAQKISTGAVDVNWGDGLKMAMPSVVDLKNYKRAGAEVWSDVDCDILEQMRVIESEIRMSIGYTKEEMPMEWVLDVAQVDTQILKNAKVIAEVNKYLRTVGNNPIVIINGDNQTGMVTDVITREDLVNYSYSQFSKVSPIRFAESKQVSYTIQSGVSAAQSGWKSGVAVLKPVGYAGVVKKAKVRDIERFKKFLASTAKASYASMESGLLWVANIESTEGLLKKRSSKMYFSAMPELTEFEQHYIIDTTTAD